MTYIPDLFHFFIGPICLRPRTGQMEQRYADAIWWAKVFFYFSHVVVAATVTAAGTASRWWRSTRTSVRWPIHVYSGRQLYNIYLYSVWLLLRYNCRLYVDAILLNDIIIPYADKNKYQSFLFINVRFHGTFSLARGTRRNTFELRPKHTYTFARKSAQNGRQVLYLSFIRITTFNYFII